MAPSESKKSRRLNIMVSESLVEWATSTAESRGMSLSALVRESLEAERERTLDHEIAEAAESLAEMYENDQELTAFTSIDGDDFA
jgi:post-segregation antitoxin (ccd killing protein)